MHLPDFLEEEQFGAIRIQGHRIGLEHLLHFYLEGHSAEMLHEDYPRLSLALIRKVIGYYLENQAEVDAYLEICRMENEQRRAQPQPGPTLEEMRRRMAILQKPKEAKR